MNELILAAALCDSSSCERATAVLVSRNLSTAWTEPLSSTAAPTTRDIQRVYFQNRR